MIDLCIREVVTDSLGCVDVAFFYYPEVVGNNYEPTEPEYLEIESVLIHDCECLGRLDEHEYQELRDAVWKLIDEEKACIVRERCV